MECFSECDYPPSMLYDKIIDWEWHLPLLSALIFSALLFITWSASDELWVVLFCAGLLTLPLVLILIIPYATALSALALVATLLQTVAQGLGSSSPFTPYPPSGTRTGFLILADKERHRRRWNMPFRAFLRRYSKL